MTAIAIGSNLGLFLGLVFGLGLPWTTATRLDSAEKLVLGAAAGVFQIYGVAWLIYWTGLPRAAFFALPVLAVGASAVRWRSLRAFLGEPEVRSLFGRQLLFTTWCTSCLALVHSYGGGEWSADWEEHFDRARFFLDRQPLGTMFLDAYSLPSRPPLANLVDGALMALAGNDFAHFQLGNTFFSTLLFLPAVLLARHFARGRRGADATVLLVLMLNPLVLQNATFAWTKLLTVFFVLVAVVFYVRGLGDTGPTRRTIAVAAVAVALLTHYSAGPYAVGLALAQFIFVAFRWRDPARWRELAGQGLLAAVLLATWFAWSLRNYGAHTTLFSNTTAMGDAGLSFSAWASCRAWNIFVTVIPHPLRAADYRFIAQSSPLGFARDYLFNIYQTTLPGAFGIAGLVVLAWRAFQRAPAAAGGERWFWRGFIPGMIFLGISAASWRDRWGVVHICLPALIVIGLTWLAVQLESAPAAVRRLWAAGLALDFALGIALHFYLQATLHLIPTALTELAQGKLLEFGPITTKNMLLKFILGYDFVADGALSPFLVLALLAMLLVLALRQAFASPTSPGASPAFDASR